MPKPGWYPSAEHPYDMQWWDGKTWHNAFWPHTLRRAAYLPEAPRWDISSGREPSFDIVGENWHEGAIVAALGSLPPRDHERELYLRSELVPEPDNPHDARAISVRVNGRVVGYLPSELAVEYAPALHLIVEAGVVPTVDTRIWGVTRFSRARGRDELKSAIRIALPAPDAIVPANRVPSPNHVIAPAGRSVQVTGEQDHFDVLNRYASGSTLLVSLHEIEVVKARSTSTVIEVRLDGERVGQLTPATSAGVAPLLAEATARDSVLLAWSQLQGSRLAAELTLRIAKPEAISDAWPGAGDRLPVLEKRQAVPGAYQPEVDLAAPPTAKGLAGWLWAVIIVAALLVCAIPYVGVLLGLAGICVAIALHLIRKRRPPAAALPSPTPQS